MTEQNRARNILFRQLTTVTHREYAPAVQQFRTAFDEDPDFILRACAYLAYGNTKIRDQEDIAVITLLQAPAMYRKARVAGKAFLLGSDVYHTEPELRGLPPYRIFRVLQFIANSDRKVSRMSRALANDYLNMLEADPMRFDGVAIRSRKDMKWLYAHNHIKPNERAQAVLFDDNPPADSSLAVLKQIANSNDVNEQARLVIDNKIPYTVAASVLPKMSPVVGVALIEVMTPTQALNSRGWVERSGLLEIQEVKDAFTYKLSQATASVASADHRKSAQGSDEDVQAAIDAAKQKAVEKSDKIESDVLLLVDKSGSMSNAIHTAVEFGSRIAPICSGELMVVAFDSGARLIDVHAGENLQAWREAFMGIRAGGGTSMQRGLEFAIERGFMPQKIVLITDGDEMSGSFRMTVERYSQQGVEPSITQITVDAPEQNRLSRAMEQSHLRYDQFVYSGDYYIFDQVVSLLAGAPVKSLIETILETELPRII